MIRIRVPRHTSPEAIAALGLAFNQVEIEPHDGPLEAEGDDETTEADALAVAQVFLDSIPPSPNVDSQYHATHERTDPPAIRHFVAESMGELAASLKLFDPTAVGVCIRDKNNHIVGWADGTGEVRRLF